MNFNQSDLFTLGVEIEFQIIDRNTLQLVSLAPELFIYAPELLKPRMAQEFLCSILEVQTGICFSMEDVENDLLATISFAEELAAEKDSLLFAASLHPFSHPRDQKLTQNRRYEVLMNELQQVGRDFMVQGLHVHVGVKDGDAAMYLCSSLQNYLPLLLALSATSPYYKGEDTGFDSYRTKLFEMLPLAGIAETYTGWNQYVEEVKNLIEHGVIDGVSDLWWDIRPNHKFGTVEVRICDLPLTLNEILSLTALIQCMAAFLLERREENAGSFNKTILAFNKWQAARHGLDGVFIDSNELLSRKNSLQNSVKEMLELVIPMSIRLGNEKYLIRINDILNRGNGAQKMRKMFAHNKDWNKVIKYIQQGFFA